MTVVAEVKDCKITTWLQGHATNYTVMAFQAFVALTVRSRRAQVSTSSRYRLHAHYRVRYFRPLLPRKQDIKQFRLSGCEQILLVKTFLDNEQFVSSNRTDECRRFSGCAEQPCIALLIGREQDR